MRIVYEEWLWDCVGYAGRWAERDYDARKPRRPGKTCAGEPPSRYAATGGLTTDRADAVLAGTVFAHVEAPVREATEEADAHEPAVLKKANDGNLDALLGDIRSGLPTAPTVESQPPADRVSSGDDQPQRRAMEVERKSSILHTSRESAFNTAKNEVVGATTDAGPSGSAQFFATLRFTHVIREPCEGLEQALVTHGGTLVPEEEWLSGKEVDYVITRL